jgi:hypothetical protein
MPIPKQETIGEVLFWSYANLAMATTALDDHATQLGKTHFMIRSRLYSGLRTGRMKVGSFLKDERLKVRLPVCCWYCGSAGKLSVDHMIPQNRGGPHGGENLVHCCRFCNSSKGATDFLEWMQKRDQFPPLYLLRRYLKLAIEHCLENDLLDVSLKDSDDVQASLPFRLDLVPSKFPPLDQLCKSVEPRTE